MCNLICKYALVNILSVYPTVFIQKWPAILLTCTLFYAISAAKATSMARTVAITMANNIRTSKTPQVRRVKKTNRTLIRLIDIPILSVD